MDTVSAQLGLFVEKISPQNVSNSKMAKLFCWILKFREHGTSLEIISVGYLCTCGRFGSEYLVQQDVSILGPMSKID